METSIMVGITELRGKVDSKQPLEERLKVAMRGALNHWLVLEEDGQFRMAVGAVLLEASEEEKERINIDLKFLRALSSATSDVPVDFGRLVEELGEDSAEKAVGLKKLWDEVKAESK